MVMIPDSKGVEQFSMSTNLHKLCSRAKQKINQEDSEVWGIYWGATGSGKSLRAQRDAFVIDPTLENNPARTCFSKDEFIRGVVTNRKAAVIADEAISIFFSRGSMTKEGRLVAEVSNQIRQKNLACLLCVPEILSIDWLILKKVNFVCYVWESKKTISGRSVTTKGNSAYYPRLPGNDYATRIIQYLKKKRSDPFAKIARPEPWITEPGNPIGETFKKPWYPVGESSYRQKKESVLDKYIEKHNLEEDGKPKIRDLPKQTLKKEVMKELIMRIKKHNPELSDSDIAKTIGYSRVRVQQLRNIAVKDNFAGEHLRNIEEGGDSEK